MNCTELESTLRETDPMSGEAADHAGDCPSCAALLRDWTTIATEAKAALVPPPASDGLRERVLENVFDALENDQAGRRKRATFYAVAAALLMSVTLTAFWLQVRSLDDPADDWIIRNRALHDVERTEAEYKRSIDRLAATIAERETEAISPRLAALQEKLLLLDQAIAECEDLAEDNPYHAGLRRQLLAVYQQKDETLREVLEATQ